MPLYSYLAFLVYEERLMKQTKFEKIIVDADKYLLTAAQSVEERYIEVTCNTTGKVREFSGVQKFWGRTKALTEASGELGSWMDFLGLDLSKDDFTVTDCTRLREDVENPLKEAEKKFGSYMSAFKNMECVDDYILCLHGEENFRYGVGKIQPYKGKRTEKPIIFQDLKDSVFNQYKNKAVISNGYESDDKLGMYAAENQAHHRKTGEYKYLLGFVDKDLKQLWGPWINIDKLEEGVHEINPVEACRHFCVQMLMGDLTDNIPGLPDIPDEIKEAHNVRKGKGCGSVIANALVASCETQKEMFQVVVDMYKTVYTDDVVFTAESDGVEYIYSWKEFFVENFRLLYMLRTEEIEFDVFTKLLDKLGVVY